MRGLPYHALAARVMQPFVGEAISSATLAALCREAYAGFDHPAVVPLIQLETNLFVQELFHGPTLSFKDMALQLIGRLFDHVLAERDARVTIVGATSSDTGSAAIEACAGRERVDIAFLHPHHRTSEVQRRQMTTIDADIQKEQRSAVDVNALVQRIVEGFRMREKARIAFDLQLAGDPLSVNASEDRLLQVFENLLDNAASFTPDGKRITITSWSCI